MRNSGGILPHFEKGHRDLIACGPGKTAFWKSRQKLQIGFHGRLILKELAFTICPKIEPLVLPRRPRLCERFLGQGNGLGMQPRIAGRPCRLHAGLRRTRIGRKSRQEFAIALCTLLKRVLPKMNLRHLKKGFGGKAVRAWTFQCLFEKRNRLRRDGVRIRGLSLLRRHPAGAVYIPSLHKRVHIEHGIGVVGDHLRKRGISTFDRAHSQQRFA